MTPCRFSNKPYATRTWSIGIQRPRAELLLEKQESKKKKKTKGAGNVVGLRRTTTATVKKQTAKKVAKKKCIYVTQINPYRTNVENRVSS